MKIKSISVENFRGIQRFEHEFKNKVTVITGKCGKGKSSFLDAVRFPLTNILPENAVKDGYMTAKVKEVCENEDGDSIVIEKEIERPSKVSTLIFGRKVGTSVTKKFIESETDVNSELIKMTTSSEILANLKPSDFASIFLTESVERKTLEDLLEICNKQETPERLKIQINDGIFNNKNLPPDAIKYFNEFFLDKEFSLETISKAFEEAKNKRREVNAICKSLEKDAKDFVSMTEIKEDEGKLNKRLEELIGFEKNNDSYYERVKAYNSAVKLKNETEKRIVSCDLEIQTNKSVEPNMKDLETLENELKNKTKEVSNLMAVKRTLVDSKSRTEKTISELDKPVCPISAKICCTTDKSPFKKELLESISDIENSIKLSDENIAKSQNEINELNSKIKIFYENRENWNKKMNFINEKERLSKMKIEIPEKPEEISITSYSAEKANVTQELNKIKKYKEMQKKYNDFWKNKREYNVLNFIVKSLDIKGPVVSDFIRTLVEPIEDVCNERATVLKTGMKVKLLVKDGLTMLFQLGELKPFLPYTSLSAGEKILAIVLMTDLVNLFSGSGFLIIDDTDHLDEESFEVLLKFVTDKDIQEQYDNIIISSVNHSDIVNKIKDYDVDHIEM